MSSQRIESSSGHKDMERKANTHIHTHHNYYTLIFGELRKSDDLLYCTNNNNKHTQDGKKNKKYKILFLKISLVVSTPTNHRFLFVDSSYPFLPCECLPFRLLWVLCCHHWLGQPLLPGTQHKETISFSFFV